MHKFWKQNVSLGYLKYFILCRKEGRLQTNEMKACFLTLVLILEVNEGKINFRRWTIMFLIFFSFKVFSIDCFKCVSMNGRNPECDDPFHNNFSSAIYESPCLGGRKNRDGLFPATSCIKIAGYFGLRI